MNSRQRFAAYLDEGTIDRAPRINSKFVGDVVELWRSKGYIDNRPPEVFFQLDIHESVPV
jgi:hypothetical protein